MSFFFIRTRWRAVFSFVETPVPGVRVNRLLAPDIPGGVSLRKELTAAPPMAGLSALLDRKNMVVGGIEDPADQEDLVGIQVPLPHFNLGHGAPGYIAALQLEFSC